MSLLSRSLGAGYTTKTVVRRVSGVPDTDVNDTDLDGIIQLASDLFHQDIRGRAVSEVVYAVNTGKTRFQTQHPFLADRNLDKVVDATDITVQFLKRNPDTGAVDSTATGTVTVEDALRGIFTTGNALPDGYECLVTHDYYRRPLDLADADEAVAYLAAHLCVTRLKGPGAVSRADLTGVGARDHGNRTTAFTSHRTKFLKLYEMALRGIRGSGGVLA